MSQPLFNFLTPHRLQYIARLATAMLGVVVLSWFSADPKLLTPLILGVIAAAVAETDDNLSGRFSAFVDHPLLLRHCNIFSGMAFRPSYSFCSGSDEFHFWIYHARCNQFALCHHWLSLLVAVYTMLGAEQSQSV